MVDFCEPIPLTEKILKTNNFSPGEFRSGNKLGILPIFVNERYSLPPIEKDYEGFIIHLDGVRVRCDYVHQLQHIIRLCGFSFLADELKLE